MVFCEDRDQKSTSPRFPKFRHLCADSIDELRAYALRVGLPLAWMHCGSVRHFDLKGVWLERIKGDDRVEKLKREAFVQRIREYKQRAVAV